MRNQDSSEIEIKRINISNGDRFTEWRPVEGVGKSIGVGDAESVTLYNIERKDSSNALDIKITYDTENLENLSLSGTISGNLEISEPGSYIYNSDILGFENLEPWRLEYAEQSEERTLSEKSLYTTGSGKGLQASLNISEKGIRPKAFEYSYNEPGSSSGRGAGIRLYDSEDGYLGGTATDNAQIEADFIDSNNPGNWGGYNNWITVKWDFNWSEGTADVTWSRPDGNEITSGKFELYRSTNVSTIELWNYNGGSWGSGNQETWWDNIRVIN
jgi:hypothetical protein